MGHVNNAVYATYLEVARDDFFAEAVGTDLADTDAALASLSVEFHAPIAEARTVRAAVWVPEVGTTSCTFAYALHANGRRVADGETVLVALDDDGPIPLPDPVHDAAERHDEPPGDDWPEVGEDDRDS
jgi:acyl-CoA thioester hydrolase